MLLSRLLGERYKEKPAEASLKSHIFLLKGGYMRQVANGIYTLLPPAKRMINKIEDIIRSEMDSIGGQEILMPVALPRELWDESGRYESVGSELIRFKDRADHDMVLGMTHEEAAVHIARSEAMSYSKYPFMIYQIQTKFRDEPRSRGGLIRVREFTMKDAYSFHTSQEDLERYYNICYDAYHRIFQRAGIGQVISVESDTGMMGGKVAHEFMLLCDAGEDTIAVCDECGYHANLEVAPVLDALYPQQDCVLKKEHTPHQSDIEGVCAFLGSVPEKSIKACVFSVAGSKKPLVVFIRGDYEVNEIKLSKIVRAEVAPYEAAEDTSGLAFGYIGPVGLDCSAIDVLYDNTVKGLCDAVCGANEENYHYTGACCGRDFTPQEYYDIAKIKTGGICPHCGKASIDLKRGIEVGNIFQLGTKYTQSMHMSYTDANGEKQTPIMGCYGIGVGRLLASVAEVCNDEYGPIWPISIAPWQVHICALNRGKEGVGEIADSLYRQLTNMGIETIYDDRDANAGIQFADADLLGVPVRIVVGPRNAKEGCVEVTTRDKSIKEIIKVENTVQQVQNIIAQLWTGLNASANQKA